MLSNLRQAISPHPTTQSVIQKVKMSLSKINSFLISGLASFIKGNTFSWIKVIEEFAKSESRWPEALIQIYHKVPAMKEFLRVLHQNIQSNLQLLQNSESSSLEKAAALTPGLPTSSPTKDLKTLLILLKEHLPSSQAEKLSSLATTPPPSPARSTNLVISDDDSEEEHSPFTQIPRAHLKPKATSTSIIPVRTPAVRADVDSCEEEELSDDDDLHANASTFQENISQISCNIYSKMNGLIYQYKGEVPATSKTQVVEVKIYDNGLKYLQASPMDRWKEASFRATFVPNSKEINSIAQMNNNLRKIKSGGIVKRTNPLDQMVGQLKKSVVKDAFPTWKQQSVSTKEMK